MDTNTIELPLFFSTPSSSSPAPPPGVKHLDTKRPCHTNSCASPDGAQSSSATDRKRFPLIEKAAAECIIRLGGHASFQIICEQVSNVLTLHHKRDFPASKLYYAAIQACLFNATDVFVHEGANMWGVTPEVQERGERLCHLRRQAKHTEYLCKLTNKLVLGMPPSFQLSDLGDDDDDNEDSGAGHSGPASHQAAQKKAGGNKKKAAPQKAPRKKGGASNANTATTATTKQENMPPPPPPPQSSPAAEASAKTSGNSTPEPKKPANEVVVKKEKEAYPQKSRGTSPDNASQRTPKASDEDSPTESGAATDGGAKVKKEEDAANRNSQCAFCGKQIQVAKRYVFYTAENGKDVDYIGGKRNALGKRKYPASGHVCNDCYKSNGVALRKEEKSDEPEAKRRKNNRVIKDDDDDEEDDNEDLNYGEANEKNADVKMEPEEEEEDKNSAKEGGNDGVEVVEEEEDGLVDISIDCKNLDDLSDAGNDSLNDADAKKEEKPEESEQVAHVQEMIASMLYSKAKESEKDVDKHGVTEDEIESYITQAMDNSTRKGDQAHKNKSSSQELPSLITKALELTGSKFKFVKNGKLWHLDLANSDKDALKDLKKDF